MTVAPFDWLEASYFYYRPEDLKWEVTKTAGDYLDKGFNVKFTQKLNNKYFSNIAVGLDDFAGTGLFTREYVVTSSEIYNLKYSIGMGWGKFVGQNNFKNPLSKINKSLNLRPIESDNYNQGGSLSYDQWFRGDASLFGGLEYYLPKAKGLILKLEYDPYDYLNFSSGNRPDANYDLRKKDSNINLGLSFSLSDYLRIDLSYIKGNTLNMAFNFSITFDENLFSKPRFEPNLVIKESNGSYSFYESLLMNLNNNKLFLQTATVHTNGILDVAISSSEHRNAIRSSSYAADIINQTANIYDEEFNIINISHINAGIELNNISFIAQHIKEDSKIPIEVKRYHTKLAPGKPDSLENAIFKPNINFPVIFSTFSPSVISHIGNPEKFFFGGLNIENILEIQFNRNLILSSEVELPLYSNVVDTVSGGGSKMEHVRTDLVQYLKEDDPYVTRMQLDYIWSPAKEVYSKISAGIFETMFGGIGGEVLYKPFDKNYSVGAELFYVKQRSFNQRFSFSDYETITGHISLSYLFNAGIESSISYGRYLAKDDGFTFDLSRKTPSGFKAGIYFTRTNVSAEIFGEGSFDKGFYFQIPMDLFSKSYTGSYSNFKLSPLTRDGGAKLLHDKDLKGLIFNTTYNELNNQWNGFLN